VTWNNCSSYEETKRLSDSHYSLTWTSWGKPVIKGTRIQVWLVLGYLAEDPNINILFEAFPRLSIEDVNECSDSVKDLFEEKEILPPVEKEL
jgi:uncharacterized protein (DUF433 family)